MSLICLNRLKGNKKDDQYRLLWAELVHLLQIGPQTPNHKKLLTFIKNENVTENKDAKRLNTPMTNSPMSPPGSSEMMAANKKKTQHLLNSTGNRWVFDDVLSPMLNCSIKIIQLYANIFNNFSSLYETQVAADRALSRKRLDFAGRLCTAPGKIAKLYPNMKINEGVYQDQDAPQFSP